MSFRIPGIQSLQKDMSSENILLEPHFREIFKEVRKSIVEKLGSAQWWKSET